MAGWKRGDRAFVCQVGIPEFGEWATIAGPAKGMNDESWYRYRVDGERKTAGLIVHESWLNREVPLSNGFAKLALPRCTNAEPGTFNGE